MTKTPALVLLVVTLLVPSVSNAKPAKKRKPLLLKARVEKVLADRATPSIAPDWGLAAPSPALVAKR